MIPVYAMESPDPVDWLPEPCTHRHTVPVESVTGETVAHLCTDCDAQLPLGWRSPTLCRTRTPEPHERGEFPLSCYACHMYADA